MHKLDLNITRLKLLLAEVSAKKEVLLATRQQYQEQIERLVRFAVNEDGALERTLTMVMDVDARLQELERQEHYLDLVRAKTQHELDSLQITKLIDETRSQLELLRHRRPGDSEADDAEEALIEAEIHRLEEIITVASSIAVQSISTS